MCNQNECVGLYFKRKGNFVACMQYTQILAVGSLILATKVWIDVADMIKQHMRMQTYLQLSTCIIRAMQMVNSDSCGNQERLFSRTGKRDRKGGAYV